MQRVKWNDGWKFWTEENAFELMWTVSENAKEVTLPHDAMMEKRAYPESPNGTNTGYRDGGVYYYSKTFTPAAEDITKTYAVKFEGVYMNAFVYVNTNLVAKRAYGYSEFYVYLNDYLKFGEENEIRVIVRNSSMTNSRWYSGGGIYRDVYLMTGDEAYIVPDGIRIHTESINEEEATIFAGVRVKNRSAGKRELRLEIDFVDDAGTVVNRDRVRADLASGEERELRVRMTVDGPRVWSDESPILYRANIRLMEENTAVDEAGETFGIRTLSLSSKKGLAVNGRQVKLRGACIHHDNGLIGAATLYDAEYRRIERLKAAGFNAVRMAHHPASPALLLACDTLGMYVMDEAFDMWTRCKSASDYALFFDKWWKEDLEAMVRKDYCHPSVILYSLGNEIPEVGTDVGEKLCSDMSSAIRAIDGTRYTLVAINDIFAVGDVIGKIMEDVLGNGETGAGGGVNVNEFMSAMQSHIHEIQTHPLMDRCLDKATANVDIAGYNYMTERYEYDCENYPNRVIVGSETYPRAIAQNWMYVKAKDNIIGDFTWTGWDYLGEAGIGVAAYKPGEGGFGVQYPCQLAYTGDLDITGFRRPASYFREIVFNLRKEPYICAQRPEHYSDNLIQTPWSMTDAIHSWSFPGYEGKPVHVEVYAPGDEVELLRNGTPIGRQPAGETAGYRAFFDTVYEPGELVAVAYENGKEISRASLKTAGEESLVCRIESGAADELTFIDLVQQDGEGVIVTEKPIEISASLEGDGELLIGSGSYKPLLDYRDGKVTTWDGRAQIVVRRCGGGEKSKVHISSPYGDEVLEV